MDVIRLTGCLSLLLAGSTTSATAQELGSEGQAPSADLRTSFAEWSTDKGAGWAFVRDSRTGYATFIHGGHTQAPFRPVDDEGWFDLARLAFEDTAPLTGVDPSTLVPDRVQFLPLVQIGSNDKWTVRYRQEVNGLPVQGSAVNALFNTEGELLSVQTTALADLPPAATLVPTLSSRRAGSLAALAFERETGVPALEVGTPRLVIGPLETDKTRTGVFVWETSVSWSAPGYTPESYTYWVDARDGTVHASFTNIHNFDVGGSVTSNASPGVISDIAANPPAPLPIQHMLVTSPQGNANTDENGDFNIAGATGPLTVTLKYEGPFCRVVNQQGANYSLATSVSGTGNALLMNPSPTEFTTSQANAFIPVNLMREWIRAINPTDSMGDFQALCNVNINDYCNAYYNGSSINFFQQGSGCANTSFSTVVAHELGHWLNTRYGTGNNSSGMGEGNSDVFAMYLFDTHLIGNGFNMVAGSGGRSGFNTRQYCGDGNLACYGQVHTDGEPWMGAAWKVRNRLNTTLGNSAGDLVADTLFLGWMNAYNQADIDSVIETQWLTLDDDNGNIGDGTPNYADIDGGFKDQGFPGYDLDFVAIDNVTALAHTQDETGPYVVQAELVAGINPPLADARLYYSVGGGPFTFAPMVNVGGITYEGQIPGQTGPTTIRYYVQGTDNGGISDVYPDNAPANTPYFHVKMAGILLADDFESGDNGWTHDTFGDTSEPQDDWQRGVCYGKVQDPDTTLTGNQVWGNDLGASGWNGEYKNNVHNYLRSPVLDCTNAVGTKLIFRRWLSVEEGIYDQARIKVNGTQIWVNPSSGDTVDTDWQLVEYDLSAAADGNPSVQIEFSLQSDGGLTYGGWNLDDVEIFHESTPGPVCPSPQNYCSTSANSVGGGAVIGSIGTASIAANNMYLTVMSAPANEFGLFFYGPATAVAPFGDGLLCVDGGGVGLFRLNPPQQTDLFGISQRQLDFSQAPMNAGLGMIQAGSTWYFQFWYRDGSTSFNLSDGLSVQFCP